MSMDTNDALAHQGHQNELHITLKNKTYMTPYFDFTVYWHCSIANIMAIFQRKYRKLQINNLREFCNNLRIFWEETSFSQSFKHKSKLTLLNSI